MDRNEDERMIAIQENDNQIIICLSGLRSRGPTDYLHRHLDFGLGLVSLDMSYNYLGNDFMRAIMAEVQQLCPEHQLQSADLSNKGSPNLEYLGQSRIPTTCT